MSPRQTKKNGAGVRTDGDHQVNQVGDHIDDGVGHFPALPVLFGLVVNMRVEEDEEGEGAELQIDGNPTSTRPHQFITNLELN